MQGRLNRKGLTPQCLYGAGLVFCISACASPTPTESPAAVESTPQPPPPNLVLVVTDDLDVPTTAALPRIGELIAEQGLSFTRAYVAQSLCAPSRASLFTGQYPHNHGVIANRAPSGGFESFYALEPSSLAPWLHDVGYRTSLVGKYINGYPFGVAAEYIPPGWDDWYGHLAAFEDDKYYNYFINDNGKVTWHGVSLEDYSTDDVARRAVEFIHGQAGRDEPFFLYIGLEAPHRPATYRPPHGAEFRYAVAPRLPSFNESDVRDKPVDVRRPSLTPDEIDRLDRLQRFRLRCMRPVEELIEGVILALAETGRLDNTYLMFTSDNGFLMGQHRFWALKGNCYEESIRVPLIVRGPGIPVGTIDGFVSNIDLAPTLLELAGAPVPDTVDGRSFVPLLRGAVPDAWTSEILAEHQGVGLTASLRTPEWAYIEHGTESIELYDMQTDPYQLESLHREAEPALLDELHERLVRLLGCRGESCRS